MSSIFEIFFCNFSRAFQNNGLLAVLGMYVPSLCSYFPDAVGYSLWVKSGKALRDFLTPFFQAHLSTLIPGQPRDVLDIYLEKTNESQDDDSSSFRDGEFYE